MESTVSGVIYATEDEYGGKVDVIEAGGGVTGAVIVVSSFFTGSAVLTDQQLDDLETALRKRRLLRPFKECMGDDSEDRWFEEFYD